MPSQVRLSRGRAPRVRSGPETSGCAGRRTLHHGFRRGPGIFGCACQARDQAHTARHDESASRAEEVPRATFWDLTPAREGDRQVNRNRGLPEAAVE